MPLDPTLDELAQQRSMTHDPEPPNPAAPYLDWARQQARRAFVEPLQTTGFIPGGQDWGRSAVTGMMDFEQGGLTGVDPALRQAMPGFVNTLGDLTQSPAARDAFSAANMGAPLVEAFWSPRDLSILRKIYSANIDTYTLSGLIQKYLPGRSPVSIRQKAFQLGLKRPEIPPYVRQPGSPSIVNDPQRVAQIEEMMKKNMTFDQMAMEMGDVSPRTVRRYINENLKQRLIKGGPNTPNMPSFNLPQEEITSEPAYEKALWEFLNAQNP